MHEKAVSAAQRLYPQIMDTVEFLTIIDRGTKCLDGIAKTADYLAVKLKELGCEVTFHDDKEYGPTVIGRKKGTGKARVLLFAHMDTVWPSGTCAKRPFYVDETYAYGPGVSDCTQGIIAALYSIRILNDLGVDEYGEIIILFNPDEEQTSVSSTKWLKHYAGQADVAICLEGPDSSETYTTSRDGSVYYNVNVSGIKAHAGVEPEKGANALEELTYKLHDILQNPVDKTTLCICWIKGGNGNCIVADNAWAMLRFKIGAPEIKEQIDRMLHEVNQKTYVKGTKTEIVFWPEGGFLPMPRLSWVDGLCELVQEASREIGITLNEAHSGGGADSASTVTIIPTIDGMAPVTCECHTVNEKLELASIVPRIALLAVLIEKISSTNNKEGIYAAS